MMKRDLNNRSLDEFLGKVSKAEMANAEDDKLSNGKLGQGQKPPH